MKGVSFELPEGLFAAGFEQTYHRLTGLVNNPVIQIHKVVTDGICQNAPDGALSCSHESGQIDAVWKRHDQVTVS